MWKWIEGVGVKYLEKEVEDLGSGSVGDSPMVKGGVEGVKCLEYI